MLLSLLPHIKVQEVPADHLFIHAIIFFPLAPAYGQPQNGAPSAPGYGGQPNAYYATQPPVANYNAPYDPAQGYNPHSNPQFYNGTDQIVSEDIYHGEQVPSSAPPIESDDFK